MVEGDRIVDTEVTGQDQTRLTTDYTTRAVEFIRTNRTDPSSSTACIRWFMFRCISLKNRWQERAGLFGDVVMRGRLVGRSNS